MARSPAATGPRVGLVVQPRMLREALALALERSGVTVVDLRDRGTCDILLTSTPEVGEGETVVIRLDDVTSMAAGGTGLAPLLAVIAEWRPGPHA